MGKKNIRNTKGRIINAAWKLFYEQGYDNTTVEEIIEESQTSKGSFYHYFEGKDALLGSLSYIFDEKYESLKESRDNGQNAFETLIFLNHELFSMIENSVDMELLTRLFSTQLITKGERHLMDSSRVYYRLLRKIISEGQEKDEIIKTLPVNEIVHFYAMCERGLMYDWCLSEGSYSLTSFSDKMFPEMIKCLKK